MRADATSVKLGVESLLSSLAFRCMSIVLVYAVLIMGLFSTVGYLADSRLNSAFPSIDDLEENRVALENDSFNELRNSIPKKIRCSTRFCSASMPATAPCMK